MTEDSKKSKTIGSVLKAIDVLEILAESRDGLGVTDISERLNFGVSATYHLLNTLKRRNIVLQDKGTRKYRIGYSFFRISQMAKEQNTLGTLAESYLQELSSALGETSSLLILNGSYTEYIAQSESTQLLKMFAKLGAKVPFYCTAGGKVLVAHATEDVREQIIRETVFQPYTQNTLTDLAVLRKELDEILTKGYGMDNEEREEGVTCIAAPIFDNYGENIAAISISGPTYRLRDKNMNYLAKTVIGVGEELSSSLGYAKKSVTRK